MTSHLPSIAGIVVAVIGLAIVLFVASRRKQDRLSKQQDSIPEDRSVILAALKKGERIRAVFDTADRTDLGTVQSFLKARHIPFIMNDDLGEYSVYLPRDVVPSTIYVLRSDEEKARKIVADYLAGKGRNPG